MSQDDIFQRILASLHEATLDDARWPAASALIDAACEVRGNALLVGEGSGREARLVFTFFSYRGQRREDLEREYLEIYHPLDERVPRLRQLPDGHLVHVSGLYTDQELKTSVTYNDALRRAHYQNGLNTRLDGADGSRIVWAIAEPVGRGGWHSGQIEMVKRLIPHVRQFVRVRQAVQNAEALGVSLAGLLANTQIGVVYLSRQGRILEANDDALEVLRRGGGLFDRDGVLRARLSGEDTRLQDLLAAALPTWGGWATGGSMTVTRPSRLTPLTLHMTPVGSRRMDLSVSGVGAVVLVVEPTGWSRLGATSVAVALGLTPIEGRIAVSLTEGLTIRDITAATGRTESAIRSHLKRIFRKQGIARQADLVRLVLSILEPPKPQQ